MKAYSSDSSAANDDLQPFFAYRQREHAKVGKSLGKACKVSMEGGLWYARGNL